MLDGDCKDKVNYGRLDHKVECLTKIKARLLMETFRNESGFVLINSFVCFMFDAEHPLVAYNIHLRRRCNQVPSLMLL